MSTSSGVPTAEADLSTDASAIPTRREGDIVPLGTCPASFPPDRRRASHAAGPSPDVGKSSNPASPVYPVLVARKAVRPSETEGSRRGGVEGSVAVRDPHPSISGGTALGAAPHGAGGTKSRSA